MKDTFENIAEGYTPYEQGWMQMSALGTTLAISIVGGLISGYISSRFGKLETLFDDTEHFREVEPPGKKVVEKGDGGQRLETEAEMVTVKGNNLE